MLGDPASPSGAREPSPQAGSAADAASPPIAEGQGDDKARHVRIRFATMNTGEGRSVSVGYAESDDSTYLKFVNNQGTETKFGLTAESADALLYLLQRGRSVFDGTGEKHVWTLICKILDDASGIEAAKPARPDRGSTEGESPAPEGGDAQ